MIISTIRSILPLTAAMAICAVQGSHAQDANKKAPATPTSPATPEVPAAPGDTKKPQRGRVEGGGLTSLFNIVQVGMTHRGIRLPIMEDRKVATIVTSEVMTRLDEHNIEFQDAVIDQKGKDGMLMTLPKAIYNKQSDQLFSSQPSTVECPEYRVEGDTLSVDRKSNVYLMTGRVRFMFFGAPKPENTENKTAAPTASPAPVPAAVPSPSAVPASPPTK